MSNLTPGTKVTLNIKGAWTNGKVGIVREVTYLGIAVVAFEGYGTVKVPATDTIVQIVK